ncbi:DUF4440 domain-containing protein [Taibaiella sp. KBW10]|uniref:YybH family protein n=1 Tax=Taibaiella sp. KBW10 TaxID=2153357 RepID=UPI000F59E836|nr:DUF4440 domain-containing protein [Taibaiella sp. KBW10]RQO30805.1 DUF4440 domain-containing protein [Taibaiella sp. KBW10]
MKRFKLLVGLCLLLCYIPSFAQGNEKEIKAMLLQQQEAWNAGNVAQYMNGYWRNDSVAFISKNKTTYGWDNVLHNYQKSYPDKATMGVLTFSDLSLHRIADNQYFVLGAWALKRAKGDVGGRFHLLYQFIDGQWLIVMDYTN